MLKDHCVTFEIAETLKKNGFDEECDACYEIALTSQKHKYDGYAGPFGWKKGECNFSSGYFRNGCLRDMSNENWLTCAAPFWQQAIDWLREKHSIMVRDSSSGINDVPPTFSITYMENNKKMQDFVTGTSYHDVMAKAIIHALNKIENEK